MKALILSLAALMPSASFAQDVFVLGEVHDNPRHHAVQAERVMDAAPKALVFEMLTETQAEAANAASREDEARLAEAVNWADSGWPDFGMYYPIFAAAPEAAIYGGGLPREAARAAMDQGIADWFGDGAEEYGLTAPLPEEMQEAREALQMAAHCDALPESMLPIMVDIQRLRDAVLARAVVTALEDTGGPVAVITGNGHARRDWGVPAYLERVAPNLEVFVLGQTEEDNPLEGGFDEIVSAPAVEREDPCAAFQ